MNSFDVLARYPLFALAPHGQVNDWLAAGQTVRLSTGETIFREGSPGELAHVLLAGRIRVLRRVGSVRELTLGDLLPGELFGEYSLLPPHTNTATCRASEDCIVASFPLAGVGEWVARTPALASRLVNWIQLHFLVRQLRGQSPFGFMSATSGLAMLHHLTHTDVAAGKVLPPDRFLFVEQGDVLIEAGGARSRLIGAGAALGEAALLGEVVPRATALSPVRCLALTRDHFERPDPPVRSSAQGNQLRPE